MYHSHQDYIAENALRWKERNKTYNPYTGEGCDEQERVRVEITDFPRTPVMYLPVDMMGNELVSELVEAGSIKALCEKKGWDTNQRIKRKVFENFLRVRVWYDFPFWCVLVSKVKPKGKSKDVPFVLNIPQRIALHKIWLHIQNGEPIRIIICKARQWGGSTLVEHICAWIQLVRKKQWHFVICAHIESASRIIRGMYTKLLKNYPTFLLRQETPLRLLPYEGSTKTKQIIERECRISIGSAERPDGLRSEDASMAHLSEVALWRATESKKPEDLIESLIGGIDMSSLSLICYESTAKGVGNFFHREWLRARNGESGFIDIFVGWQEKENCILPINGDVDKFIDSLSEYEQMLFWNLHATLEHIAWYRKKAKEIGDDWRMKSENPSSWEEAFQSTGRRVFSIDDVIRLRGNCCQPMFVGDIGGEDISGSYALSNISLYTKDRGDFMVWEKPDEERWQDRYVVVVDVGKGQTAKADYSDILVLDRMWMAEGGVPEVVAEWHGHIDMDLLAWKAAQIATFYQDALLVIESNTLETNKVQGDSDYILEELRQHYPNIYRRRQTGNLGFHTNIATKKAGIIELNKHLRELDQYIERNSLACDEFDTYEESTPGQYNAVEGCHDDRVMTRVIGMWICYKELENALPRRQSSYTEFHAPSVRAAGMASM